MQDTLSVEQLTQARGEDLYASDGEKIGSIEEVFYDQQTRRPEWVAVSTGLLGRKQVLVPVEGAELRDDGLYVPYSKEQVNDAPEIDTEAGEINEDSERELYSHYGITYSERRSETTLPEGGPAGGRAEGAPTVGPEDEAEMTRHEEELKVGKRPTEAGRARLRKWVETEPVSADVELQREAARVRREPVDQPASEAGIGEREVEVPLRGEEPVVEKETVAKERVAVEKDVDTQRETVGDEVRKERVEADDDVER